jgi:hypothetical protein
MDCSPRVQRVNSSQAKRRPGEELDCPDGARSFTIRYPSVPRLVEEGIDVPVTGVVRRSFRRADK